MRLSWEEVRAKAAAFAHEHRAAHYEKGEAQTFYNEFFRCFGVDRRTVATFEARVTMLARQKRGFIDLFWPGTLIIEAKSAGGSLDLGQQQALDYFDAVPSKRDQPRYILTCTFQRWRLLDLDEGTTTEFALADLPKHVEAFDFILGTQRRLFRNQSKASIEASELVGKLHDALAADNYTGHDLERLLVRLLFCLFADDTGIFQKDAMLYAVEEQTRADGSDLGDFLTRMFQVLDTPDGRRQTSMREEWAAFPYVNGRLFAERIDMPNFNNAMREMLLDACRFDWGEVSPAIFGSLFQSVLTKAERRKKGAHYTTEANIRKVIEPLFLDDLLAEFERARSGLTATGRRGALVALHDRLAGLKFLDPACGCGNFLVVAYRELRDLEMRLLQELRRGTLIEDGAGGRFAAVSRLNVDQFYGIELEEFPALIAETALWMTDHIANQALAANRIDIGARIPLTTAPGITQADALEIDWADVLPPGECSYVMGNPPFGGFVFRSVALASQAGALMERLGASGSRLDYVAAWFLKAAQYLQGKARVGFVSTNSLSQGEQVAQLWPALFDRWGLEIAFAHRTFAWGSDARGKAHVHVVVIGLTRREDEPIEKRLFSYNKLDGPGTETRHVALTPYLFGAETVRNRHLVVTRERESLCSAPQIRVGTKPVDDGHYIFDAAERALLLAEEPGAEPWLHPFLGGEEFINGGQRWLLYLRHTPPDMIRAMPRLRERIAAVRAFRETTSGKLAQSLASQPTAFHVELVPDAPFLVIPEVSSERREYAPIGWLEPPAIPSNKLLVILRATPWHFAVVQSAMHMAWLRHIGGRLESRYQYSSGLVYNTFPWPEDATAAARARVAALAEAVLGERAKWPTSSLADLYDPNSMPAGLRAAHARLDTAVDRLYRAQPFASERERVEHLFGRYERLVDSLSAAPRLNRRTQKRVAAKGAARDD